MKTPRASFLLVLALGLLSTSAALAAWQPIKLDRVHSQLGFTASTLLFDVDGRFSDFSVWVDGDPSKPETAKVKVEIKAASIDTDNDKRDTHLKNSDFFDVAKYPLIRFESTKIVQQGKTLKVSGILDMHGKKQPVTIPFKIAKGKNGAGMDTTAFKGKLSLDRTTFGIGSDSIAAKISLENEVELDLLLVTFL